MKFTLITLSLFFSCVAFGQRHEFSLVTYNSLRYSPTNIDDRHPQLRQVHADLQADILSVQELSGQAAAQMYLDSVLNFDSATYSMANFVNGNDLDIALYYKTAKFNFIRTDTYSTTLRDIYHFQVWPIGSPDSLHIFSLHLKASPGSANQQRRKDEVDVMRQVTDNFAPGTHFLVCGDFNIYTANEIAYNRLLEDTPGNDGHFVDQISLAGTWNRASYAMYHTQSPRSNAFNGGASGGMDDRFDMVLMSETLDDTIGLHYVPNSMYPYGNDGQHFDMSINDLPTNTAVGQILADALYFVSDHIPVVANFAFEIPPTSGVSLKENELLKYGISLRPSGVWIDNSENKNLEYVIYSMDGKRLSFGINTSTENLNISSGSIYLISIREVGSSQFVNKLLSF